MQVLKKSPEIDNAIVSPTNWGDEKWVHEQFAWLRSNEPLKYLSPDGFEPFWNVTKYEDIKTFEGDKRLFVNDPRPTLSMSFVAEAIEQLTGRKHLVRSLVQMDDPDHMQYRRLTQSWFVRGNLRKLQSRIDQLASEYVDRMLEMGGSCDFVKDVAIWFPLRVIMSILGVPEEDEPLMLKLTQELFGSTDPDVARSFEMMDIMNVVRDFEDYFGEGFGDFIKDFEEDLRDFGSDNDDDSHLDNPPSPQPIAFRRTTRRQAQDPHLVVL